jgi:hypothetical protein
MFVLEILLGLKSMQGNVTCAFLHADLEENKKVYVSMPMGFAQYDKNGKKKCLKLKKTLYKLRQSHRAFWKYAKSTMIKGEDIQQSNGRVGRWQQKALKYFCLFRCAAQNKSSAF